MRVDISTGKGTSGMDKFSSKVHRVHMELGGKLLNSLRIETQVLERLQSVSVVDGAAHTQKDDVESNGGSLEKVAMVCAVPLRRSAGDIIEAHYGPFRHYATYICEGQLCVLSAETYTIMIQVCLCYFISKVFLCWLFVAHQATECLQDGAVWLNNCYIQANWNEYYDFWLIWNDLQRCLGLF